MYTQLCIAVYVWKEFTIECVLILLTIHPHQKNMDRCIVDLQSALSAVYIRIVVLCAVRMEVQVSAARESLWLRIQEHTSWFYLMEHLNTIVPVSQLLLWSVVMRRSADAKRMESSAHPTACATETERERSWRPLNAKMCDETIHHRVTSLHM